MIIGSKYIFIEKLTSTNTYAHQLLLTDDLPEGTIFRTGFQSAGRGQMGNKWESENGKNLLFSIVLYPSMILPSEQFLISMTISLGICDFLKRNSNNCTIKWPNDIYMNNDKIAGILIEHYVIGNEIKSTIAGIGLNINQDKFISGAPNPISLKMITGREHDLDLSLNQLLSDLDKRYKQLIAGNFNQVRKEYILQLYRLNEWSDFKDLNGIFKGRIISVTEEGRLQIERGNGVINEYLFKEVEFIH
jgi:BirA family transcriptional regulator, biotin operon repressor / biotin---[acetyl-CoA-carboxylase] ligase